MVYPPKPCRPESSLHSCETRPPTADSRKTLRKTATSCVRSDLAQEPPSVSLGHCECNKRRPIAFAESMALVWTYLVRADASSGKRDADISVTSDWLL
jgi:hypothetical protein